MSTDTKASRIRVYNDSETVETQEQFRNSGDFGNFVAKGHGDFSALRVFIRFRCTLRPINGCA